MNKPMTAEELKTILDKHQLWIDDNDTGTRANLYGANLDGANLDGANLYGANLYGANLTRANLTRANLDGANLDGANLTRANLDGANLYGANLDGANLDGANLDGANLTRANLDGANLDGANLDGANLTRANLTRANLYGANLDGANLTRANLDGAKEDFLQKLAALKNEAVFLYKALLDGRINGSVYSGECACFIGTIANARKCDYHDITEVKIDQDSATERLFLAINKGDTPENNKISAIVKDWMDDFMAANEIKIPTRKVTWED